ncbi:MAG: hypothetical protein QF829_02750 [Candidatus Hydrothermarchaeota archaeon]|nr:hypothetical protein [Candidatus Hydrothermarchaeota archaeon]
MSAVIKVKKETSRELTKIVGRLTIERGKKATYDDAIRFLLGKERAKKTPAELKGLIKKSYAGASQEDYVEYSYEDV